MKRLVVIVDSLRFDHYQYMTQTQSFFGPSHDRAFAVASATGGAFPQMMTGSYDANGEIDPADSWLTEIEDPTCMITTNRLVSERYGFDGGVDAFSSPISKGDESIKDRIAGRISSDLGYRIASQVWSFIQQFNPSVSKSFRTANDVINEFDEFRANKDNWCAILHFMEPHHPYDPMASSDRAEAQAISREAISTGNSSSPERVRDLYRREVTELDDRLKPLWNSIDSDTKVIFTADHGEMLGEDSIWGHPGQTLHPAILQIPFATKNIDTSDIVSFIDIPALMMERGWRESQMTRDTAFSSMGGVAAAFDRNHMMTQSDVTALDSDSTEVDPALRRAFQQFDPNRISKTHGVEEDLRALGYLE